MSAASPSGPPRHLRVFVSSTFRDMREERDMLVKQVFPQLRRLCESRGVVWGEVDLRWGVTDEQAAEGRLLPICLEEIERCQPWFIGLLGERYGTVAGNVPDDLRQRLSWLAEYADRSVTELEILHGVLRPGAAGSPAFLYFRDPRCADRSRAGAPREECVSASPEEATKLASLKERIRDAAARGTCRLRENYADPHELGRWVLEDFTRLIDTLYPETRPPDPLEREAADHEAFALSRARVYVWRAGDMAQLDAHAQGGGPPLVVTGEAGVGKSALLANWALRRRREHPGDLTILHFIGASRHSADWAAMLRRLLGELQRWARIPGEIPSSGRGLREAFEPWLQQAGARGRVVLVLDGLNQLEDHEGALGLGWLPAAIPAHARLVLSSLPGEPLEELRRRRWPALEVRPLTSGERREVVQRHLALYSKSLSAEHAGRIVVAPPAANPLYLRTVLEEIRLHGDHGTLRERIDYYLAAPGLADLFERLLERYRRDYEDERPGLVGEALSALWAARRGLSEAELLELLGQDGQPLPHAVWAPFALAAEGGFLCRNGLNVFAHQHLREAVARRYLPGEAAQAQAHRRLADYFRRRPAGPRQFEELPWQLWQSRDWQPLARVLTDLPLFVRLWQHNREDVLRYWAELERHSPFTLRQGYHTVVHRGPAPAPGQPAPLTVGLHHPAVGYAVAELMKATGHWEEAMLLREVQLQVARESGDPAGLQACLGNLGVLARLRGDMRRALRLHQEEEEICRELGASRDLAMCLGNLAVAQRQLGHLDQALALAREQLELARQLGDPGEEIAALGSIANIHTVRGEHAQAESVLREAQSALQSSGGGSGLVQMRLAQAVALAGQGKLDEAERLLAASLAEARARGDRHDEGICLDTQAVIHRRRGDADRALECYAQEAALCREIGDQPGLAHSLASQAALLAEGRRWSEAFDRSVEAEAILRRVNDRRLLAGLLEERLDILEARGDLAAFRACAAELVGLRGELSLPREQVGALVRLAAADFKAGQHGLALRRLQTAERQCRERRLEDLLPAVMLSTAAVLVPAGRPEEALARCDEALRLCEGARLDALAGRAKKLRAEVRALPRGGAGPPLPEGVAAERDARRAQVDEAIARGDDPEAARHWEALEGFCRRHGDDWGLLAALEARGQWLFNRGDFAAARGAFAVLETEARRLDHRRALARSLASQGVTARREDRLDEAEQLLRRALEALEELGDEAAVCETKVNLALVLDSRSAKPEALALLRECEAAGRRLGDEQTVQNCLGNQAGVLADLGEVDQAAECLGEQERLCRQIGHHAGLAMAIVNRGILDLRTRQRPREALPKLAEGCRLCAAHRLPLIAQGAFAATADFVTRLARPFLEGRAAPPDDPARRLLADFAAFGLEFRELNTFALAAGTLLQAHILYGEWEEAGERLEDLSCACARAGWREAQPHLARFQAHLEAARQAESAPAAEPAEAALPRPGPLPASRARRRVLYVDRPPSDARQLARYAAVLRALRERHQVEARYHLDENSLAALGEAPGPPAFDALVTHVPPEAESASYDRSLALLHRAGSGFSMPIVAYTGAGGRDLRAIADFVDEVVEKSRSAEDDAGRLLETLERCWQEQAQWAHVPPPQLEQASQAIAVEARLNVAGGLGLAVAATLCRECRPQPRRVTLHHLDEPEAPPADAKDLFGLARLGVPRGAKVRVTVEGPDAAAATLALRLYGILTSRYAADLRAERFVPPPADQGR